MTPDTARTSTGTPNPPGSPRPRMRWLRRTLLGLLVLAGVILTPTVTINFYPGLEAAFPWMRHISLTRSMKPVALALDTPAGPVRFVVPKAYLRFAANQDGGAHSFIVLWIDRRGMRPAALGGSAHVDAEGRRHMELAPPSAEDFLYVTLNMSRRPNFIRDIWIPYQLEKYLVFDADLGDGVHRYHTKTRVPGGTDFPRDDDYLLVHEDGVPTRLITCLQPNPPLNVGCTLSIDLTPYVYVEITFRRSRLSDWRMIEAEVRALIDKLIIATPQGE